MVVGLPFVVRLPLVPTFPSVAENVGSPVPLYVLES